MSLAENPVGSVRPDTNNVPLSSTNSGSFHRGFSRPSPTTEREISSIVYPQSLRSITRAIHGEVTAKDNQVITAVENTRWHRHHWDITNQSDLDTSAHALGIGVPVFHQFGNFAALTFHPHLESMRSVNAAKGRGLDQVASVTTTREHVEDLFDWDKLPTDLTKDRVLTMIDTFYNREQSEYAGPFGFRGPAAAHIPDHLTSNVVDPITGETVRTVQLIAPGYMDRKSNELFHKSLEVANAHAGDNDKLTYLAITSANISSKVTGKDEPAHFRIAAREGLKSDFGRRAPGFIILGHPTAADEEVVRGTYPYHEPNSTTILDFSRAETTDGVTSVFMARHGSLSDDHTARVLAYETIALGLQIDEHARPAMELRHYPPRTLFSAVNIFTTHHR